MESRHVDATPTTCRPCAECGSSVATSWHSHTFKYGSGASAADLTVRVPIRRCDDCDFDYLDDEAERIMHEAVCHHLGVLTPSEVRGIREYHGLSRAAFAKITGIGEASLGRWENGIKVQTPANDRYLRLLAQPSILGLLQEAEGVASVPAGLAGRARFRRIEVSAMLRKRQRSFSLRPRQAPVGLAA